MPGYLGALTCHVGPQVSNPYATNGTDVHGVREMCHKEWKMGTKVKRIQPVSPANFLYNMVKIFANTPNNALTPSRLRTPFGARHESTGCCGWVSPTRKGPVHGCLLCGSHGTKSSSGPPICMVSAPQNHPNGLLDYMDYSCSRPDKSVAITGQDQVTSQATSLTIKFSRHPVYLRCPTLCNFHI